MTIANCPKCREQVSIPLEASRHARVRCPLCSEEYLLDDALRSLPPLLVVVADPETRTNEVLDESPSVVPVYGERTLDEAPPIVSDEASGVFRLEPSPPVAAPAFNFEPDSAVPVARGSSVATRPRARRKQGSALRMMIQTVGGGVMGLVIAQLILWWMPGKWANENRDPFGMAAKVAPYTPFLVPVPLRSNAPTAQASRATNAPKSDLSRSGAGSAAGENAGPKSTDGFGSNLPEMTFGANSQADNEKSKASQNNKAKGKKKPAAKQEEFPAIDLNEPGVPDKAPTKEPDAFTTPETNLDPINPTAKTNDDKTKAQPTADAAGVSSSVAKEKSTKDQPVGVSNPPAITAADVTARLSDVVSAERAWDTAENPTLQKKLELITDLYVKLAQLGDTVARRGGDNTESAELLSPVAEKLKALTVQSNKLVPLGKLAGRRLNDDRDKGGILVGVVLSQQPRGTMFETKLRLLATSDPVVAMVSPTDLGEQLPTNSTVLVLGRWISNPAERLSGYEGDAESVLLHGVHVTVPTASPP